MTYNTAYIMAMNERRRQTLLAAYRQMRAAGYAEPGTTPPNPPTPPDPPQPPEPEPEPNPDVSTPEDLQSAIQALEDGGTVKLAADVQAKAKLEFNATATLNLDGHTLTLAGTDGGNDFGAVVSGGKTLTVENGTVTFPARGFKADGGHLIMKKVKASGFKARVAAVYSAENGGTRTSASLSVDKDCVFTSDSSEDQIIGVYGFDQPGQSEDLVVSADICGKIINTNPKATVSPVSTFGSDVYSSQKIVLHDGAVVECASTECPAIYFPSRGELVLEGGSVKGTTGIYTKGGKIIVPEGSNAVVEATQAEHVPAEFNNNGCTNTGEALTIDNCHTTSLHGENLVYFQPDSHEVKGGTFKSACGVDVGSYATHGENLSQRTAFSKFVSGGVFSSKVDDVLVADGFKCVEEGESFKVVAAE